MGPWGAEQGTRMRFFERCHRPPAGDTMRSTRGQSTSGRLSRRCSGGGSHKLGMGPLWGMEGAGGAVGGSGAHPGCRRSKLPFWDGARRATVAVWRCAAGRGAGQMTHEVCWATGSDWGRGAVRGTRMRFFERCHRPPASDTMRSARGHSRSEFGDVEPVWARGRCPMGSAGRWGAIGGAGTFGKHV